MTALLVAVAMAAATRADVNQVLAAADAMESAHAFDAARRQLDSIVGALPAEEADSVRLRICGLWARQGEVAAARQCYGATAFAGDEARARARYHAAALGVDAGDALAALALAALIYDLPHTLGARRALLLARGLA
ncbi:MAG: hypothetical protein HYZ27_03855, partial [Deltaproteobacteria bacterium]|nr:hypothetical protein [Deltaproteobacteria bacterium]